MKELRENIPDWRTTWEKRKKYIRRMGQKWRHDPLPIALIELHMEYGHGCYGRGQRATIVHVTYNRRRADPRGNG